jgi:hypothetical protein
MTRRRILAVALVLTLAPAAAFAQPFFEPGEWVVSPAFGIAFDPDADVSPALAAAIGYPVTSSLVVEAEFGHLFDLAPGDPDVDSSLTTLHGAALFFFETDYLATPYLAGGIGVGHLGHEVTVPAASIHRTEIGVNLGGGISYPLRERLMIGGDFRYFTHIDDVPSAWRFLATVKFPLRQ